MNKAGPLPTGYAFFLPFTLVDDVGNLVTGATTSDFTVWWMRNGVVMSPASLYVHEKGDGRYHLSNQASGAGYLSSAVEDTHIDLEHNTIAWNRVFDFWTMPLTMIARSQSVTVELLLSSVNQVIEQCLKGQVYKIGEYELRYADIQALFAVRRLLTEEIELATGMPYSLAEIQGP